MAGKITLPRRRFFRLKGGQIELAIGFLLSTILEMGGAHASEARADTAPNPDAAALSAEAAAMLEALGGDVSALRTMTVEELKTFLTPEMLAQLDLGVDFLGELDTDLAAAIRDLEAAFRKKIVVAAQGASKVASEHGEDADHQAGGAAQDDSDAGSGFDVGGVPLLAIIGGLAIGGGAIALAVSGDDDSGSDNRPPIATNDAFTVAEDGVVTFDVRANDVDADGDTLTVTQINGTAITTTTPVSVTGGVVSLGADGRLTFTPTANYNGAPTFTYTVSDGAGATSTGTVNGTVTAVNDVPVATNDTFTMPEDGTPAVINVRANDTDVDGDTLTVTAVNGTAITAAGVAVTGGLVTLVGGNLVFTPAANYNGTPSFTYTVVDGKGGTATATVSGTVTPVADAPVNALPGSIAAAVGVPVLVGGLAISDVDGAAGTFTTTLAVSNGTLSVATVAGGATVTGAGTGTVTISGTLAQVNAALGATSFTSGPDFAGGATLTMTTSDGVLTDTDTLALTVGTVLNGVVIDGYISGAQLYYDANNNGTLDSGEPIAVSDAQGRFSIVLPVGGTGTIVGVGGTNIDTGLPNLMPLKAPFGSTVVNPITTLVATLMESGVSLADANATVAAALDLPVGIDFTNYDFLASGQDPATALAVQKAATQIAQIVTDAVEAGVSADAVVDAIAASTAAGAAVDLTSVSSVTALLVAAGASQTVAQSVAVAAAAVNQVIEAATSPSQISDAQGEFNTPGANLPPVAVADTVTTTEDGAPVTINLIANDIDPEGGALTLTRIGDVVVQVGSVVAVTGGTVTVGENGSITFTPAPNFNGTPSFTYTVADAGGQEQVGTVGVTVTPVNDAPEGSDVAAVVVPFGTSVISPLNAVTDVDGDALTITAINGQAIAVGETIAFENGSSVTLNADGTLTFQSNSATDASFTYTVSDGQGGVSTATVNVAAVADTAEIALTSAQLANFIENIDSFPLVSSIDVTGDVAVINAAQAAALVARGVAFVDGDEITFEADSSRPNITLKGMQDLNVDTVAVRATGGRLTIEAGAPISALGADVLPQFDVAQSDADLDVTLNIAPGALETDLDIASLAASLRSAGVDHLGVTGETSGVSLSITQAQALETAGIDFTEVADVTLSVSATDISGLSANSGLLSAINIDHLDVIGDVVTLNETEAAALIGAGVDFVDSDDVTLEAEGTTSSITLKGMQDLNVDSVSVRSASGALSIDAGASLAAISADALPQFNIAQSDDDLEVTLNIEPGALASDFDLATLAAAFDAAGIDQLGVSGQGGVSLSLVQAEALQVAGINFVDAADVTLSVSAADVASIASSSGVLGAVGVDQLDVIGDVLTISETQAQALIDAGVSFVDGDDITLEADGTQANVTLKGMQDLNIDSISVRTASGAVTVDAGASLQTISADALPQFTSVEAGTDLDVTLNVEAGGLDDSFDLGSLASAFAAAGVDHLESADFSMNFDQASDLASVGLDFTDASDVTVNFADAQLPSIIANSGVLAAVQVDHLHAIDGSVTLTDADASALVAAGVDFVESDDVTVEAAGTQMSTSLQGLQSLNVDSVAVAAGVTELKIDAGDLAGISAEDLPQFDLAQTDADLDVTLFVDADQLSEVERLAEALRAAGVDHFALGQPIDSFDQATQDLMAQISQSSDIDFVYDPDNQGSAAAFTLSAAEFTEVEPDGVSEQTLLRELIAAFEQSEDSGVGGTFELTDGTVSALAESGTLRPFAADHLVVDGTHSGDQLLTTLKDIADFGIDEIKVEDTEGPTYVNLGALDDPTSVSELTALIDSLTGEQTGPQSIFSGNEKVALVVEADVAHALSQIEDVFAKLAAVGFTEVDVLATDGSTSLDIESSAIEVKLIGQDDDLYRHLHDDHR